MFPRPLAFRLWPLTCKYYSSPKITKHLAMYKFRINYHIKTTEETFKKKKITHAPHLYAPFTSYQMVCP